MCELKTGDRTKSCLEILRTQDTMAVRVCDPCHREAEDKVIEVADGWYDTAHSASYASIPMWKDVCRKMDLAVQMLRKIRSNRKFGGN